MSVAKVIEINASSPNSFEEAIASGVEKANQTLDHVSGVWVKEQKVDVKNGEVDCFRVDMKVTFILDEKSQKGGK